MLPTILMLTALIAVAAAGCSSNKETPDITAVTVTPTQAGSVSSEITPSQGSSSEDVSRNGNEGTGTPSPTQGTDPDVSASPTPSTEPDPPSPTEKPDDNTLTGIPDDEDDRDLTPDPVDSSDKAVIEEYWNDSFLIWLPMIDSGRFKRFESDETHDYITLEDITVKTVKNYIKNLSRNGFSEDAGYSDVNGNPIEFDEDKPFRYSAYNNDGWNVQLDYDPDSRNMTISSGYDSDKDDDEYGTLKAETLIGKLPDFTWGDFDSSKQEGSMVYCIFSNVDPECSDYVKSLKKAGFTEEADEGNEDGIVWYIASNAEGLMCEFIYTEGAARIGCGRE